MGKVFALALLIGFSALVGKGWHWAKDGFHVLRLRSAVSEDFGGSSLSRDLEDVFDQPFSYLGRGHQCYAFTSRDGKYVLKLPRLDRYEIPFWMRACRVCQERLKADLDFRLRFILESFRIASGELQPQTGVLYLHLGKTAHLKRSATIVDRVGRRYTLDLDRTAFILQEKKALMMPAFERALKRGDAEGAKRILNAFLEIVEARARMGIFNKDPSFLRNFGLDGERGLQIDIGSFYRKPGVEKEQAFAASFSETTAHVHRWLAEVDPEIQDWFDGRTKEILSKGN